MNLTDENTRTTISGLVITMSDTDDTRSSVLAAIESDGRFEVGQSSNHRLPVVLETESDHTSRVVMEWLRGLHGVMDVAIAFVDFASASSPAGSPASLVCSKERMS